MTSPRICMHAAFALAVSLLGAPAAFCQGYDWSVGGYAGQYYDTEPAGIIKGKGSFLNQYLVAINASKELWHAESLPLSLEVDGMFGYQFGQASLFEMAVAPVVRWNDFPWDDVLPTDMRVGPVGISYTSIVSPLERGTNGKGSQTLNFFFVELAFLLPEAKSQEIFVRLHHRCSLYDVLNKYGANGEDFLAFGFREYY